MVSQKHKIVVALLLTLGGAVFASTDGSQRLNSSSGFAVLYPGSWFRIGVSTDRLQLLSSKRGAEGIVIKPGQAEITGGTSISDSNAGRSDRVLHKGHYGSFTQRCSTGDGQARLHAPRRDHFKGTGNSSRRLPDPCADHHQHRLFLRDSWTQNRDSCSKPLW
jgi:hypothetical protein